MSAHKTIIPHLWFDTQAREAAEFYCAVFADSVVEHVGQVRDTPSGDCDLVSFSLAGQPFMAISAGPHFSFAPAISFVVKCETQAEIDQYWSLLSAVPEAEQCGWCKDRYGVSWQIVPAALDHMLRSNDAERVARVTRAFLQMKKFDVAMLQRAFDGGD